MLTEVQRGKQKQIVYNVNRLLSEIETVESIIENVENAKYIVIYPKDSQPMRVVSDSPAATQLLGAYKSEQEIELDKLTQELETARMETLS